MKRKPIPFRFDRVRHEYIELATGLVLPHITGLLDAAGLIDDRWYTEESCERGTAVHNLTASFDLGGLDLASCVSPYRGYLLGYVDGITKLRALLGVKFLDIEVPMVHRILRFGGRPDRTMRLLKKALGILEVKTGDETDAHPIQTALQAILAADEYDLPAEAWLRYVAYVGAGGRCRIIQHKNPRDFVRAREIIREYAA